MANTKQTKKYLDGWDTSAYDDIAKASQQSYQTNWDILKNRYNNLVDKNNAIEKKARNIYANSLAAELNNITNTYSAVNDSLSKRNLENSGIKDKLLRQQVKSTANNVNDSLYNLLNTDLGVIGGLYGGLNNLIGSGVKLDTQQGNDQGGILSKKLAEDLRGQQLAATLAESDAQRELQNELKAKTVDNNEEIRKLAVWDILNDRDPNTGNQTELTDGQKSLILSTMYDVADADKLVALHNSKTKDVKYSDKYNELKKQKDKIDKLANQPVSIADLLLWYPLQYMIHPGLPSISAINTKNRQAQKLKNETRRYNTELEKYKKTNDYIQDLNIENVKDMSVQDYYDMIYNKK